MLADYIRWQYVEGPQWILRLVWNLERASYKYFSIDLMLKTLVAHWHKDAMVFEGGTITQLLTAVMWNIVSRLIGFIIRSTVIVFWLALQVVFLPLAALFLLLFVLWPVLVVVAVATGLALFVA